MRTLWGVPKLYLLAPILVCGPKMAYLGFLVYLSSRTFKYLERHTKSVLLIKDNFYKYCLTLGLCELGTECSALTNQVCVPTRIRTKEIALCILMKYTPVSLLSCYLVYPVCCTQSRVTMYT